MFHPLNHILKLIHLSYTGKIQNFKIRKLMTKVMKSFDGGIALSDIFELQNLKFTTQIKFFHFTKKK
jgi:hypothetical protein